MSNRAKYLECWRLRKTFAGPGGPVNVVQDFDLNVADGEFVCLIGHSGCGKSTVLSMVAGLLDKSGGAIILADKEVRGPGPDRGVVFQTPCLLPWLSAIDNVMLGINQVYPTATRRQRLEVAVHYLRAVGLGDSIHRKPDELSGGMRQRVGIARAFALSPRMLLLDEPFGMLDQLTRLELQEVLLKVWREKRITALMVTHDVDEALFLSDRVAMMTSGPAARVGEILDVPFPRPRDRQQVLEHPEYYRLRERLIGFLEDHEVKPAAPRSTADHARLEPAAAANLDLQHASPALN
jgi:nitrate ABC transporter ATP-binding subunit